MVGDIQVIRDDSLLVDIEMNNSSRLPKNKYKFVQIDKKEWEIIGVTESLEYALKQGFNKALCIKRIGDCKPYVKRNAEIYVLVNNFDEVKFRLNSEENGLLFTELLGDFHNAIEGFNPPTGVKLRVYWGKRMEEFRVSTIRFERYLTSLSKKLDPNEFEECVLQNGEYILKCAKASMKILKSIGYLKALEDSMKRKEACINSISNNTAILYGERVIIKNIFSIGYNMVEEDIAVLIKKLIIETENKEIFKTIMDKYLCIRSLGDIGESIVKALVNYPIDSVKVVFKYLKFTKELQSEDSSFDKTMKKKLMKNIKNQLLTEGLEG